eukprot:TRINITY_DN74988_c0_g1_i1.p1 TRINITY_DN74988_c0_g1~~TRINITY_DN74988_c0_g1_i1.p1  ORF type:complete len:112 (-),score=14.30 TRINITY_DN74988_c0_g1_i1:19-321(-)
MGPTVVQMCFARKKLVVESADRTRNMEYTWTWPGRYFGAIGHPDSVVTAAKEAGFPNAEVVWDNTTGRRLISPYDLTAACGHLVTVGTRSEWLQTARSFN